MTGYKVMKRTRMCFVRTDGQSDHYRAFATMSDGALIICYMFFFYINVPFGSDYFVLISQHNLSVFSFRGLKELEMYIHVPEFIHRKPKTRSYALTVKCGIGMTAIRAAKCVAHILYRVLCSMC